MEGTGEGASLEDVGERHWLLVLSCVVVIAGDEEGGGGWWVGWLVGGFRGRWSLPSRGVVEV